MINLVHKVKGGIKNVKRIQGNERASVQSDCGR